MKTSSDMNHLRLQTPGQIPRKKTKAPRHKNSEWFLKGPVPLNWLTIAGRAPGRALHVAIVLWYRSGLTKSGVMPLPLLVLKQMGVDRYAARRGLAALEEAGLVSVKRTQGKKPVVTLLDAPEDSTG